MTILIIQNRETKNIFRANFANGRESAQFVFELQCRVSQLAVRSGCCNYSELTRCRSSAGLTGFVSRLFVLFEKGGSNRWMDENF